MTAVPPAPHDAAASPGEHPSDEELALCLEGSLPAGSEPSPDGAVGATDATGADDADDPAHGLLGPGQLAAIEGHLAACSRCQARQTELVGVPALLRALGADDGQARMPDDVADRLERALADAATTASAATPGSATPGASVPGARTGGEEAVDRAGLGARTPSADRVLPLRPRRTRGTALLSAAAALAAVGLVGGVVWGAVSGSVSGSAGSTSSAGGVSAPALPSADGAAGSGSDASGPVLVRTALDLDAGSLAEGVRSTLRQPPSAPTPLALGPEAATASGGPAVASPAAPLAGLLAPGGLQTCAQRLAPDQPLREVLTIRWQGDPAAVLVFPTAGDPGHVDAYAVAPACPVGEFLGFVRLPA